MSNREACTSCGSEVREHRAYVPGRTGQPVPCGAAWHDEDIDLCTCCQENETCEEDMNDATGADGLCDGCRGGCCGVTE